MFCGSKLGQDELYAVHARQLGKLLALQGCAVVYGGGNRGLMGAVANGALAEEGRVVGIIPDHLVAWEQQHLGLTELVVVPDMHTRKRMMYERSSAAIILPGGFGTMDELFELLTWNQLSLHNKPVFILNSAGFYTPLFQMMQAMHHQGFLYDSVYDRVKTADTPDGVLTLLNKSAIV